MSAQPVGVALPAPALIAASGAVGGEVHQQPGRRSHPIDGRAAGVRAVGELHEDRVVALGVADRVKAQPDAIAGAARCLKRRVEIVGGRREWRITTAAPASGFVSLIPAAAVASATWLQAPWMLAGVTSDA